MPDAAAARRPADDDDEGAAVGKVGPLVRPRLS
jgi:hypothetical protein